VREVEPAKLAREGADMEVPTWSGAQRSGMLGDDQPPGRGGRACEAGEGGETLGVEPTGDLPSFREVEPAKLAREGAERSAA
jgi:hypothetical protein